MTTLTQHANLVAENRYYQKDTEGNIVEDGD